MIAFVQVLKYFNVFDVPFRAWKRDDGSWNIEFPPGVTPEQRNSVLSAFAESDPSQTPEHG